MIIIIIIIVIIIAIIIKIIIIIIIIIMQTTTIISFISYRGHALTCFKTGGKGQKWQKMLKNCQFS